MSAERGGVWQSGSRDEIFERLFESLRREVPDVATDPALIDPALRLMLKSLAAELEVVHSKISQVEDQAFAGLLRRLLTVPRSAMPAQTVVHFVPSEPGIEIGPSTVALGATVTRTLQEGKAAEDLELEFRPPTAVKLGEFAVIATVHVDGSGRAEIASTPPGSVAARPESRPWQTRKPPRPFLLFCVEAQTSNPSEPSPRLFVDGPNRDVIASVLWGRWRPVGRDAGASFGESWTPARWIADDPRRKAHDVLGFRADQALDGGPYAERFVTLPLPEAAKGVLPDLVGESGVVLPKPNGDRWWWRVELAGDPQMDTSTARIFADCVPVANIHLEAKGEIVPDLRRQAIVLPVGFEELTDIQQVLDLGAGISYRRAESLEDIEATHVYILRQADNGKHVAVHLRNPPRGFDSSRIEVHYTVTFGEHGNGIGAATLNTVQRMPGLLAATNLVETTGGRAARASEEIDEEIRGALRHHGRAVTAQDYHDLALALGAQFATDVEVKPAVELTPQGAIRCVDVRVTTGSSFTSEIEREAFRTELQHRLGQRAPVGTRVRVVLQGGEAVP